VTENNVKFSAPEQDAVKAKEELQAWITWSWAYALGYGMISVNENYVKYNAPQEEARRSSSPPEISSWNQCSNPPAAPQTLPRP